jgi:hypothetical protein
MKTVEIDKSIYNNINMKLYYQYQYYRQILFLI